MKINLLPKEERPLKQSSIRPTFIVGLVGLLLLGVVLFGSWQESMKATELAKDVEKAISKEAQLQAEVKEVNLLRQELRDLEAKGEAYGTLFVQNEGSLVSLPRLVDDRFPGLWIAGVHWNSTQVLLSGYTQNMTSISKYLNYLNERSEEVKLSYVQAISGTGFIVFEVEVKGVRDLGSASLN